MTGWRPIFTAPRETGRPLLLYPFRFARGSAEKIEALPQPHWEGPLLDLSEPAVKRFIKLAKRRGYRFYSLMIERDLFETVRLVRIGAGSGREDRSSPRWSTARRRWPEPSAGAGIGTSNRAGAPALARNWAKLYQYRP
jgi:hypothetical protein